MNSEHKHKVNAVWRLTAGALAAASLVVGQVLAPVGAQAATSSQSILPPAYSYPHRTTGKPNTYWNATVQAGERAVPWVVMNPNNGPGDRVDENYTGQIDEVTSKKMKYVGYVIHHYQTVDIKTMAKQVDKWYSMYKNVGGIFFDTVRAQTPEQICYAANLYNYVKVKHPGALVIQNPGTHLPDDKLVPYGDIFLNAETTATEYLNNADWNPKTAWEKDPANAAKQYHVVRDVTSKEQQAQLIAKSRERNAGWIYFTGDTESTAGGHDGNPYDDLSRFFGDMAASARSAQQTQPIIGKPVPLPAGCNDEFNLKVTATSHATPAQPPRAATGSSASSSAHSSARSQASAQGSSQSSAQAHTQAQAHTSSNQPQQSAGLQAPNTGFGKQGIGLIVAIIATLVIAATAAVLYLRSRRFRSRKYRQ